MNYFKLLLAFFCLPATAHAGSPAVRCTFMQFSHTADAPRTIAETRGNLAKRKEILTLKIGEMEGFVRILKENKVLLLIQNATTKKSMPTSFGIMEPNSVKQMVVYQNREESPDQDFQLECTRTRRP